jgi:hypothetical protein
MWVVQSENAVGQAQTGSTTRRCCWAVRRSLALDHLDDLSTKEDRFAADRCFWRTADSDAIATVPFSSIVVERHHQHNATRKRGHDDSRNHSRHTTSAGTGIGTNYTPRLAPPFVGDVVGGIPIVGLKDGTNDDMVGGTRRIRLLHMMWVGGLAGQHETTVCLGARGSGFHQGMSERIVPLQQKHP